IVTSTVKCWPARAVAGHRNVASAARPSAGRPLISVKAMPKIINSEPMSRGSLSDGAAATEPGRVLDSSLTCKRGAAEDAADEPNIALRHAERVPDVARTIAIDVADFGVNERRLAALSQADVKLRCDQRIPDVDHAIPIDIAAGDRCRRRGGRARR